VVKSAKDYIQPMIGVGPVVVEGRTVRCCAFYVEGRLRNLLSYKSEKRDNRRTVREDVRPISSWFQSRSYLTIVITERCKKYTMSSPGESYAAGAYISRTDDSARGTKTCKKEGAECPRYGTQRCQRTVRNG
jgi:hypothetical protein